MGKWIFGLCVSLYVVLIVFGGDGYQPEEVEQAEATEIEQPVETEVVEPEPAVAEVEAQTTNEPELVTSGEVIPAVTTATLEVSAPNVVQQSTSPVTTALVSEVSSLDVAPSVEPTLIANDPITTPPPLEVTSPVGEIWTVTGSRVNLRSGASTRTGVVGQTVRGESAEIVELLENGWAKVYILESGIEAYMSANFLSSSQG